MADPWMKWYPSDWRADPALRSCSLAARGLWVELLGFMHEAEPYGHLLIGGSKPTIGQIAKLVGAHHNAVAALITELVTRGVAGVVSGVVTGGVSEGVIFSRRMIRDHAKALKNKANGSKGGNPAFAKTVNPHIPEARSQKPEKKENSPAGLPFPIVVEPLPPVDYEKQFFDRAVEVIKGPPNAARSVAAMLLKACGKDIAKARSSLELSVGRSSPKTWIMGHIHHLKKRADEPNDATVLMTNADDRYVIQ